MCVLWLAIAYLMRQSIKQAASKRVRKFTIRNKRTVKQLESRPPPLFLELPCFCGLIFTESQKLNSHMFQEHIHSQEF